MRTWPLLLTVGALLSAFALAQPTRESTIDRVAGAARFVAVDIFVDVGTAELGAYQLEFRNEHAGGYRLVGVEGGEDPAFSAAPYYDPAALNQEIVAGVGVDPPARAGRIILASFSTDDVLPTGVVRVATLHLMVDDDAPEFGATLIVAGDADGNRIPATVEVAPVN